ncbi:tRNA N6-adenosine(37)-N6-threonylcarbamoyltransferase complex dimerization subunit TsaB [Enterovibrio norvegicus FF-33]|uniref:tRNA threonylcarbamoyladenosine biosynthesis protein TsaB n=1 Tax=Enterovibrio norvegicus FF-454 TaxID=1185651 RepID=A0A1E5C032_9GAMM|nr:tRNA (adenosine(37)-N6)-threonylcarbamoyltransferase complex dimerization subunit type 1 TsaB [Enterovibrio norvegicus]OEE58876.1 tRNA N6-adenosine(37)-N6-threonylcarbamoyltransferase complex dimerization subunit TsaB [Enterovibrio norvegicus FF-454]OEE67969.1 tRNA N6-adenosine(37)-N6-threonylcarbamoyltransferase complex dimerization subunit TsaB [Enterovibrio norvegicus FF-33]OEE75494.1 tRNA N6-adenosine(37)-N6-threonylcarbamoyltransferase complex dimerization subunit TsaB [Enterovibrio norv
MTSIILAVDTATENCSVALKVGNETISRCEIAPREHTTKILPMVDSVLAEAGLKLNQLDALAFGRGPGSFTGVRIGIGIAQGLAFGANLPMVGVSTLAAMAQQAYRRNQANNVLATIDARMNEIYVGGYQRLENGDWKRVVEEAVLPPDHFRPTLSEDKWFTAGTGWQAYPDLASQLHLETTDSGVLYPEAEDMLILAHHALERGEAVDAEHASPVYLRDTVAWKKLPGRE